MIHVERLEYLLVELTALLGTDTPAVELARARQLHEELIVVLSEWQGALASEFGLAR